MRRGGDADALRSPRRTLDRLDWRVRVRQAVDALAYAAVLTGAVAAVGAAVGLAFRGNLVAAKRLLFLVGFGLIGYAAFRLRSRSRWRRDSTRKNGGRPPRGLQAVVARTLPSAVRPPPDRRLSASTKLFVAGAAMLLVSMLAEVVIGIGV